MYSKCFLSTFPLVIHRILGTYNIAELSRATSVDHHNVLAATVDKVIGSLALLVRDGSGESTGGEGEESEELHVVCWKNLKVE